MSEAMSISRGGPFPEIRDAFTQRRTWGFVLGYVAILIFGVRWPLAFELLGLWFPVALFCWAAISSGAIRKLPMLRIVIAVVMGHSLLFAGALYVWSKSPQRIDGDFGFYFIALEVALIVLLLHFARNGQEKHPPSE